MKRMYVKNVWPKHNKACVIAQVQMKYKQAYVVAGLRIN